MMTPEQRRAEALSKMTPAQREEAERKAAERARKRDEAKQLEEEKAKAEKAEKAKVGNITKRTALKEMSHYFRAIQLGKYEYNPNALNQLKKLLNIDDYDIYRDQYVELIRTAFLFRTPQFTHPIKTEAAKFLDAVMTKNQTVELGLILGLLTEKYISKSLAMVLENQASLIKKTGYRSFIFQFAEDIFNRNGNLEEDGSVTPFTEGQRARVEKIYNLYK